MQAGSEPRESLKLLSADCYIAFISTSHEFHIFFTILIYKVSRGSSVGLRVKLKRCR